MFVMLVFLGLRTGLVIASLIPMAMVMALMIMGFLEIGLDQMLLAALIIALGMLVDNAIVMSESIMVQLGEGKPAMKTAFDSPGSCGFHSWFPRSRQRRPSYRSILPSQRLAV